MEVNTSSSIGARTTGYAVAKLLERGQHVMLTERFGQIDPQPRNKTRTRMYRRYNSLPRATAPLAEGVVPQGRRLTSQEVSCTLEQYGDIIWTTNVIEDTHEDPVGDEMYKLCGEQAGETIEVVRIAQLKAGSNVYRAGGVATRNLIATGPRVGELENIIRSFNINKARKISDIIPASPNTGTSPVKPSFFAMCSTDLEPDLRRLPGYVEAHQYGNHMKALPNEHGTVAGIRFLTSALFEPWLAAGASGSTLKTNGGTGTGAADVYPIIIVAKDAYAIVPLQGKKAAQIFVKSPKEVSVANPIAQLGFVSWTAWDAFCRLHELWMCRYEVGAVQTPSN